MLYFLRNQILPVYPLLFHYLVIIIAAIAFCLLAWYKDWLSISGAVSACILAINIVVSGGWTLAVPMVFFFISSSLLSKLPSRALLNETKHKKPRDYIQVICNGGIAGIICVLYFLFENSSFILLYFISIAISTSDTWSSEAGNYFNGNVFDILSLKKIKKGLSGGVSFKGTMAGLLGSLLVAFIYYFLYDKNIHLFLFISIAGFAGMVVDSILGSWLQAKYLNKNQELEEIKIPGESFPEKGLPWMSNDLVNLLSNAAITIIAYLILGLHLPHN